MIFLRWVYSFGFVVFSLIYLPIYFLKGKHRGKFWPRLGFVSADGLQLPSDKPVYWVHAVSVGEVNVAQAFIRRWSQKYPNSSFVLTSTTVSGLDYARKLFQSGRVRVLPFPMDLAFVMRRFIRAIQPKAIVLMETEIWPNLIWEAKKQWVPIFVLNARISDQSFPAYRRVAFAMKHVLKNLSAIGAQDDLSSQRFASLGATPKQIFITGNMKYDWKPVSEGLDAAQAVDKFLGTHRNFLMWVVGSTHPGEEEIILQIFLALRGRFPQLFLVLAPRHVDRTKDLESLFFQKDIQVAHISDILKDPGKRYDSKTCQAIVVDQVGYLAGLYALADVVFLGGSLVPIGGHNFVEPAFYSKPIVTGPHLHNFKEMSSNFLQAKAVQIVEASHLERAISQLLENQTLRHQIGEAGGRLVGASQGAIEKNLQLIEKYLVLSTMVIEEKH